MARDTINYYRLNCGYEHAAFLAFAWFMGMTIGLIGSKGSIIFLCFSIASISFDVHYIYRLVRKRSIKDKCMEFLFFHSEKFRTYLRIMFVVGVIMGVASNIFYILNMVDESVLIIGFSSLIYMYLAHRSSKFFFGVVDEKEENYIDTYSKLPDLKKNSDFDNALIRKINSEEGGNIFEYTGYLISEKYSKKFIVSVSINGIEKLVSHAAFNNINEVSEYLNHETKFLVTDFDIKKLKK